MTVPRFMVQLISVVQLSVFLCGTFAVGNEAMCYPRQIIYDQDGGTGFGLDDDTVIFGINVCNDQTIDPDRPSNDQIRSFSRQMRQLSVLIKSIVLHTTSRVHFAMVVDTDQTFGEVIRQVQSYPNEYCKLLSFSQHPMHYPRKLSYLKFLNRPCSSQRHFFPSTFAVTDRIINLDTDIIILDSVQELWGHFHNFNSTQVVGMSSMIFAENDKFRKFPKPQHEGLDDGINTGISLFAMDKWRRMMPSYEADIDSWFQKYGRYFVFPTQDIFNVWLGLYPEQYYELPCEWNFRKTFSNVLHNATRAKKLKHASKKQKSFKYDRVCVALRRHGAKALHGAGGHFTDGVPGFSTVFDVFEQFDLANTYESLKLSLKRSWRKAYDAAPIEYKKNENEYTQHFIGRILSRKVSSTG